MEPLRKVAVPVIDTPKRQQILDGARRIFLSLGFDAASVNDVAEEAGVSKATLYAYFPSKEKLFETLVFEDRRRQAERIFDTEGGNGPIDGLLRQVGRRLVTSICQPEAIAYSRLVMATAARFPELGRAFFDAGPAYGVHALRQIFAERHSRGEMNVRDPELAAAQFIDLCHSCIIKPLLFGARKPPDAAEIDYRVEEAVAMIMARYGVK